MNIIHLPRRFTTNSWGGTETVVSELVAEQISQGHQARIFCSDALSSQNEAEVQGVPVKRFSYFYPFFGLTAENKRQLDYKGGNMFSFSLMKQLMKESEIDLIHLHTLKRMGGIGRYCALKRQIPYAITLHGGLYDVPAEESSAMIDPLKQTIEWGKGLGFWVGSRRVLNDAHAIFCIGKNEFDQVSRAYPGKKVYLSPNGVNCQKFSNGDGEKFRNARGISRTSKVILLVGRIDPQKNQLFAVNLLQDLRQAGQDIKMVFIGHITNDGYYQELLKTIRNQDLETHITIIKGIDFFSSEIVNAYHSADLIFLPSIHEPFGVVILEAWASKKPIVASRVGGIPSFVESGKDGLLCRVNHKSEFLESILAVLKQDRLAMSLAENGYKKAISEFSWKSVTQKAISIYEEIIFENSRR